MRAQATAASQPACPAPTITTSNCSVNCTRFYCKCNVLSPPLDARYIIFLEELTRIPNVRICNQFMTAATAPFLARRPSAPRLGIAWILMCAALAIHVIDEALTGFLAVYNPTVLALRDKLGFWPMPTFQFRD